MKIQYDRTLLRYPSKINPHVRKVRSGVIFSRCLALHDQIEFSFSGVFA